MILPGFGKRFHEYYHVESVETQPNSDTSIVMRLEFETSSDEIIHSRSVYTFLDFLGDIGGLLDMLIQLASFLWTVAFAVSGSELTRFLISALFVRDKLVNSTPQYESETKQSQY